jgi:hypothetical protein
MYVTCWDYSSLILLILKAQEIIELGLKAISLTAASLQAANSEG